MFFKEFFAKGKESLDLDEDSKLEAEIEIALTNVKRIIPLAILLIFVEIGNGLFFAYKLFFKPNIAVFVAASIYLLLFSYCICFLGGYALSKYKEDVGRLKLVYRSFWLLFSFGIVLISAVEIAYASIYNNYIIFFVLISVVPLLTINEVAMIILPNLIIVLSLLFYNQGSIKVTGEIAIINLAAIVFSQVLQKKYFEIIASKKRLETANSKLETMAETDELTNLFNRRGLENKINVLWPYCIRNKTNVAAIMLDIDYFKGINDTYGHAVGDSCLKSIARCLTMSVRRVTDVVARVGERNLLFSSMMLMRKRCLI